MQSLCARLPWLCLVLLIVFPLVAPALNLDFYVSFVRRVLIFALAATSLNFILGYGGMVRLGMQPSLARVRMLLQFFRHRGCNRHGWVGRSLCWSLRH
jgi:hypothetical protein